MKLNHSKDRLKAPLRSRETGIACWRALFFLLPLLVWGAASIHAATDPDLPGAPPNFELIPAGSLVIAMDNNLQLDSGHFNMKAYGLVNSLLQTNIPVKWAIAAGKAKDGIDFTADVERLLPTALTATNLSFLSGPFIVHRDFTNKAMPIITNYGNNVAVYRLTTNATVDIRYTVAHKPHVAVLDDGGTQAIHTSILDEAGFPTDDYTVLNAADVEFLPLQSCYTIVTSPHFDGGTTAINQTHSIRDFVLDGGNFLAQCAGVRTYEDNAVYGHFHSTLGFSDNNSATSFDYPNADMAFIQFQGVLADQGGSLQDWTLAAGSVVTNHAYAEVVKAGTTDVLRAGVSKLTEGKPGSLVFYLGGHNYSGNAPADYNGRRMYMNAVFVPPDRPPDCLINFQTDLAITKDNGLTTVTNNQLITYQIVVTNVGPGRVVGAPVTDNFPPSLTNVTWTATSIGGGTSAVTSGTGDIDTTVNLPIHGSVVFSAQAVVAATASGVVSNTASISVPPGMIDPNPDSNQSTKLNMIVHRPVANDDAYSLNEDNLLTVDPPGVLGNDTDPDGDSLSALLVSEPSHGELTFNADGSFSYAPAANYNGPDTFTYYATDGTFDSAPATVMISVNPVNDAPVAVNDNYSVSEDTTLAVNAPGILGNDSDIDGDSLSAVLVSGPSHGTLSLNSDGSFSYSPAPNYNGPDSFTYQANDGQLDSGVATVTITVIPVNDAPVAVDDSYSVNEDRTLTVEAPGVLGNDTDIESESLGALLVSEPAHGTLTFNANGSFKYVPAPNYNGLDSFTYKANDGQLDSGVATVTITVIPVNDAPVAVDDHYNVNEDTTLTVEAPGVLDNDTDVEGDSLSAMLVSEPAHGTLTFNANGSFQYVPTPNYNGLDSFTYKANDGQVDSGVATVSITVIPVNDALIISDAGANVTIECPNTPVFTPPTATGGCDPNPRIVEVSDETTPGACAGSYMRTKTWKAVDACGNESPARSQTITVVDTTAPVLTCPPDKTVEEYTSTDPDITGWATAVDESSPATTVSYTDVTNGVSTITTIARTWTATDCAGNRSQGVQTITVVDRSNEGTLITDGLGCTLPNNQFRLIFTPDLRNTPCYKLNASNPGQFFYNLFYAGTPGSIESFKVTLPYPFVTQGARPIQVYDGVIVHSSGSQTCLVPGNNISAGPQQVTLSDYAANPVMGVTTYTLDVTLTVPATGFLFLTVHLDYGLKISSGYSRDAAGDATACANTGEILIPNNESYTFSVAGAATDSATVSSYNTFKRHLGVRGSGQCRIATFSASGATLALKNAKGALLGTGVSDQDGWCVLHYNSTVKASTVYVTLTPSGCVGTAQTRAITLKPNGGDVEVDFTSPQASSSSWGQRGDGRRGDGAE